VGVETREPGGSEGHTLGGDLRRAGPLGIHTRNPGVGRGRALGRGDLSGGLGIGTGDPGRGMPDCSVGFGVVGYDAGVRTSGDDAAEDLNAGGLRGSN
jgi:hypothetical protein